VLEKHHALRAFEVMVDQDIGILNKLNTVDYWEFRSQVMKTILATEIARHKEYIAKMQEHQSKVEKALTLGASAPALNKQLEMEMLIKAADISNVIKPFHVASRWAIRVTDEFFLQGDEEEVRGMARTPMCNRATQSRVALQLDFIDFVCAPFFDSLAKIYPQLHEPIQTMHANRVLWKGYPDAALELDRAGPERPHSIDVLSRLRGSSCKGCV